MQSSLIYFRISTVSNHSFPHSDPCTELTDLGLNEARSLNAMLDNAKWFPKLTAGRPTRAIVSPLSRCLQTAGIVTDGLPLTALEVEENIRETLGEDTCDARR